MSALVYTIIEAVIFMIPILTLFVKIGKYAQQIEDLQRQVNSMNDIESRLSTIESKLDLLIEGKIKIE